jgi:hypothetical protein
VSEAPPGIDLEKLAPWFSDHVAPVDSLSAKVVGHGRKEQYRRLKSAAWSRTWRL